MELREPHQKALEKAESDLKNGAVTERGTVGE